MSVKVSVVIPAHQRPLLLKRCVEALLLQNCPPDFYEIIVVADGPDEAINDVFEEFIKRNLEVSVIGVFMLSKKGPAAARNAGWQIAQGPLILFTDDDCIPDAGWVESFYKAFKFYASSKMAFSGKIIVPHSARPTDFEMNTAHLETAAFVTANCACTRKALETIGGFDEAFTMAWREDSDLEFKLVKANIPIIKIEEAMVIHPVRKAPWGVSIKEQKKAMFDALLFKKHPVLFKQRLQSRVPWFYLAITIAFIAFLSACVYHKKTLSYAFFTCWFVLVLWFTFKRLAHTSHSFKHVMEMVVTSVCIPFVSIFWNLYGAFKYRALHL